MIENYNGGYKKALLDVKNFLECWTTIDIHCKSKKKFKTMIFSLLDLLLSSPEDLENFKSGSCVFMLDTETAKVKKINPK